MDFFIARQPIINGKSRLFGYELLFRGGLENYFTDIDADIATKTVITNTLLESGISKIVKNKRAFINFTKSLIEDKIPLLLPSKIVVIELLEDIEPDKNFIKTISEIKTKGYTVAVDDFVFQKNLIPLIELADILKIDFMELPDEKDREKIVKEFMRPNLKFLAEKVETEEEFRNSLTYGYSLFQGYFFAKPELIKGKKIPSNKAIYMQLLQESLKENLDFRKIENILKKDVDISVKLLKYINSPFFGFRYKIESIKHSLALLGENEFKKWVTLISLANLSDKEGEELIRLSLTRGKLFELLSNGSNILKPYSEKLFLTGLLSTLDAILKKPMDEILQEMPIAEDIKDALSGKKNLLFEALELSKFLEYTMWEEVDKFIDKYKIDTTYLFKSYTDAMDWAENILSY